MVKAAKKRKKEEDEEFAPPEFDEAGYLRKEVESAKVALVGVALAVPVAGLLYALTVAGVAIVAFFLGLAFVFLLPRFFRILPWPPVDTAKFERKDWITRLSYNVGRYTSRGRTFVFEAEVAAPEG